MGAIPWHVIAVDTGSITIRRSLGTHTLARVRSLGHFAPVTAGFSIVTAKQRVHSDDLDANCARVTVGMLKSFSPGSLFYHPRVILVYRYMFECVIIVCVCVYVSYIPMIALIRLTVVIVREEMFLSSTGMLGIRLASLRSMGCRNTSTRGCRNTSLRPMITD